MNRRTLLILAFCLALGTTQAAAFTGTVEHVHDGDTLTVDGVRVRLHRIDAPELGQPGGREALEFLSGLTLGRRVEVIEEDVDKYDRIVGLVILPDGTRANVEMVGAGHAWVYRQYCHHCYGMLVYETSARWRGLGLWAAKAPVPPWKWRKKHRRHK